MPDLPPVFSPDYYRSHSPDLTDFSEAALAAHFQAYGVAEGRPGAPQAFREQFLSIIPADRDTLEIGPYCRPSLRGDQVRYFDVAGQAALMARAENEGADPAGTPFIHYVSGSADLTIVDAAFDQVFSSHCIEHQPDLVRHLNEVSALLRDGGRYFLVIPDKRYCFDHCHPESTIAGVIGAYLERRRAHDFGSILAHFLLRIHNNPTRHWDGDHGDLATQFIRKIDDIKNVMAYIDEHRDHYIDSHAWYFTPSNFTDIVGKLRDLELIDLKAERVYNTPRNRLEFCAVLSKA